MKTDLLPTENSRYDTDQGAKTEDRLFLLCISEVKQYFNSNEMRVCQATEYAKSLGATNAGCAWWLRTSGQYQDYATHVWQIGGINNSGTHVNDIDIGVRPAMWIDLSQDIFSND